MLRPEPRSGAGPAVRRSAVERPPALEARALTKIYAGGTKALDSLRLIVPRGSFFGLLGPNGAGKSTLIGAAAGLVRVSPGQLFIFGHDAVADAQLARLHLGLAPQEIHLDRFLTSQEMLAYHGRYFGMARRTAAERAQELLRVFDLSDKAQVRPNRLSGGMRRRLLIARALMHRPALLVLDEPTAGVDLELRHELWRYLRRLHAEEDSTILLTTHYLEEAEALCEEIAFIREGRIVAQGSPAELRTAFGAARLEHVYLALMSRGDGGTDRPPGELPAREPAAPGVRTGESRGAAAPGTGVTLPDPRHVQARAMAALAGREVRRVLSLWSQTVVPPVLTAVLYLAVFGGALGTRMRQLEGVDYLSFILPGLLVMTVAGQAFGNNATSIFQAKYEGYIEDVLSSPLSAWRMTIAYMAGGLVRSLLTVVVVSLVAGPFAGAPLDPLLAAAALALTALLFAGLGVLTGIWAETFDQLSFVANLVIAPLSLVAGVFYSARSLPGVWSTLTRLDPIYYLVAVTRQAFVGLRETPAVPALLAAAGLAVLLFMAAAGLLQRGWRLKA